MRLRRRVLAKHSPWLALRIWDGVGHFFRSVRPRLGWKFDIELSPTDRAVLASTDLPDLLVEDVVEAFRMGSRGPGLEALLLTREWDFRLEDIQPEVHLWQACMDTSIPAGLAHYQASRLPHCRLTLCEGEGHFSMLVRRMEDVLRDLIQDDP